MSSNIFRNIFQYYRSASRFAKYSIHSKRFEGILLNKSYSNGHFHNKYIRIRNCSSFSDNSYEKICVETLESLTDFFEELQEENSELSNGDISYNDGVLTINLGKQFGIYVINRQLPNKQIWLSSPISGPKRYDYENGRWVYKHDNQPLHSLLEEELSKLLHKSIDLSQCLHYKS